MSAQILLALAAVALPVLAQQAASASLTIHADRPGPQVNRQLFGQFAEHLGAGIYGGIWVGEDSKIPNTDRKSTRLNSSHLGISYAVFCLKKKKILSNIHCRAAGVRIDSSACVRAVQS